ncbi:endolytic transglycosylase MltG [Methylophilaceae bacterium]|nr:endolytic transglycosylase MltG [Methylophilaceae bacterium]
MNLIKLKLIFIRILNISFIFFKKNKPVVVNRINNILSGNKNLLLEKNLLAIKSMVVIFFFWVISYPFISLNVDQKNSFLEVKQGENITQIANKLVKQNVLSDIFRFKLLAKLSNRSESIKIGHYFLKQNISPNEILSLLESGKGILYPITFIEGSTLNENLEKLKINKLLTNNKIYNSKKSLKLGLDIQEKSLEGLFFPDTYYFFKGTSGIDILKESHSMMMQKLDLAWENKTPNLPYKNKYEALIVASIIEKELGNRDEANLIAGVFVNRMRIGMPLQSDPTVIYGMQEKFNGNLTKQDLMRDTPYNTYTRNGLPPSPICLPGFDVIEAALNPAETNAFYFVAKGDNKTHHFSKTLKEHNKAVKKYQR